MRRSSSEACFRCSVLCVQLSEKVACLGDTRATRFIVVRWPTALARKDAAMFLSWAARQGLDMQCARIDEKLVTRFVKHSRSRNCLYSNFEPPSTGEQRTQVCI